MTTRRAAPYLKGVPPVRHLRCWHRIPYPAARFLDLWGNASGVDVWCLYCGKFQPVIVTCVTEDVALVIPDMI